MSSGAGVGAAALFTAATGGAGPLAVGVALAAATGTKMLWDALFR